MQPIADPRPSKKASRRRDARQLSFQLNTWGGSRKGAGRKPRGVRAGVSHLGRPPLASRFPVHVTLRVADHVWNLRSRRSANVLAKAFFAGSERLGLRLCGFSVQGNHIHMLVEARNRVALSRGIQGLSIRIARGLNTLMGRQGRVFADRYHARILCTPTEVRRARSYILENHRKHRSRWGQKTSRDFLDSFCVLSPDPAFELPAPRTWLLSEGWQRGSPSHPPPG